MKKRWVIFLVCTVVFIPFTTIYSLSRLEKPSWSDIYTKKTPIAKGWKSIIVHHSATDSGNAKSFHKYHTSKGYGGLCYHFVIGNGNGSPDGKIEEGFRWKEQIAGTHVDINSWYHNIFGIGICLVGNFEKKPPTEKQMASLSQLIKDLSKKYGITQENIMGHNQVPHSTMNWDNNEIIVNYGNNKTAQTACPGKHISMF